MRPIHSVLCTVDFTPVGALELELAGQLCERFGAELILQHDVPETGERPREWIDASMTSAQGSRRELALQLGALPPPVRSRARAVVTHGPPAKTVAHLAADESVDLIIQGCHRRSREHRSVTEELIEIAPCPVLTTHDQAPHAWLPHLDSPDRIRTIVPTDFAPHSLHALRHGLELAELLPLDLVVLYAPQRPDRGADWAARRMEEEFPGEPGAKLVLEVAHGDLVDAVIAAESVRVAQLVLMAAHHRSWIERLLAGRHSRPRDLLTESLCPVWVVPAGAHAKP